MDRAALGNGVALNAAPQGQAKTSNMSVSRRDTHWCVPVHDSHTGRITCRKLQSKKLDINGGRVCVSVIPKCLSPSHAD